MVGVALLYVSQLVTIQLINRQSTYFIAGIRRLEDFSLNFYPLIPKSRQKTAGFVGVLNS